ncbi:MAG TPA: DUF2231 domain-containing protein [Cytophagales bacterium]|nr:DUF2231 domain-containing protein [Cytophagales bacterium]
MSQTSFWRAEIWHPLSVHFPIALLIIATLTKVIVLILKNEQKAIWQKAGSGLLYIGCLSAWIAIYTGDMADGVVARKICDPTILKDHEIASYNLAYLFTAASLLDLGLLLNFIQGKILKPMQYLVVLLSLIGASYLVYTGHLGATLVYQQGAGVIKPSFDCSDFQ